MGKRKLTISPCTIERKVDTGKKFEVMLNPASYQRNYSIAYNKDKALGQLGSDEKFSAITPQSLTLNFVIDGTGVVPPPKGGQEWPDVEDQVRSLKKIVYEYKGDKHEPNYVRILWSTLIFFGRLRSMSVDYTLFSPEGKPLRAKINLTFNSFISRKEEAAKADKQSPDLTRVVTLKAGESLPGLCHEIYGDSFYYTQVARINNITNIRDIRPGTALCFPPLR